MANFARPPWEVATAYDSKPVGIAFMYVPLGKSREIALYGGVPNGKPLWVDLNDCGSAACPAKCAEKNNVAGAYRFFTITGRREGNSMLEARAGGPHGALWDSVQVVVERPIAWGASVSHAFKAKVIEICNRLRMEPDYLMACMAFETGLSFSPSVRNAAGSGAVGLIQFMPATARGMHTSTAALAGMSAVQQLDYVERFMRAQIRAAGVASLRTLEDVYMAILYPAAVGRPDAHVLFRQGTTAYTQNAGLDRPNPDGTITKFEAAQRVRAVLVQGRSDAWLG